MKAFQKEPPQLGVFRFSVFLSVGSTFGALATQSLGYWVCVAGTKGASTSPRLLVRALI